ncbi:mediator of RNA polymerase II transcription subunit 15a-like [Vigna unguiculata]|uniref:mediator of RNA polymerase II transcription subunit 15a-like n=1 Tax=Vigna unguiculata TaxID=3917 RepID=UPI001015EF9F|nr:mediator of RNA polymerase II transcription subunit 15a-like [Vigna unguiculata]
MAQAPGVEVNINANDWRASLSKRTRSMIVSAMVKQCLPFFGSEGLDRLRDHAKRFEEKTFTTATSLSEYLLTISMKLISVETRACCRVANPRNQV